MPGALAQLPGDLRALMEQSFPKFSPDRRDLSSSGLFSSLCCRSTPKLRMGSSISPTSVQCCWPSACSSSASASSPAMSTDLQVRRIVGARDRLRCRDPRPAAEHRHHLVKSSHQ